MMMMPSTAASRSAWNSCGECSSRDTSGFEGAMMLVLCGATPWGAVGKCHPYLLERQYGRRISDYARTSTPTRQAVGELRGFDDQNVTTQQVERALGCIADEQTFQPRARDCAHDHD